MSGKPVQPVDALPGRRIIAVALIRSRSGFVLVIRSPARVVLVVSRRPTSPMPAGPLGEYTVAQSGAISRQGFWSMVLPERGRRRQEQFWKFSPIPQNFPRLIRDLWAERP
jgi:hypothetical protein